MAHIFKNCFFICGFLLLGQVTLLADGRETTVFYNDGTSKIGELLFVRDTVIGLLTTNISDDREIVYHSEKIVLAKVSSIRKIILHEYNPSGALTGTLIGAGGGAAVGLFNVIQANARGGDSRAESESVEQLFSKTFWGAVVGMSVGWLVATLQSKDEVTLSLRTYNEIRYMYQFARFSGEEPGYLYDIIDNLLKEAE